jgi:hypothetical protein
MGYPGRPVNRPRTSADKKNQRSKPSALGNRWRHRIPNHRGFDRRPYGGHPSRARASTREWPKFRSGKPPHSIRMMMCYRLTILRANRTRSRSAHRFRSGSRVKWHERGVDFCDIGLSRTSFFAVSCCEKSPIRISGGVGPQAARPLPPRPGPDRPGWSYGGCVIPLGADLRTAQTVDSKRLRTHVAPLARRYARRTSSA